RTQTNPTARIEKTFFTKRTQIFLVLKAHKSFLCKGLRRQGRIFAMEKTNPNEPNRPNRKNFFRKRTQVFLIEEGSQILLLQGLTKAQSYFRYQENEPNYQENEPKRTQLQPVPTSIPARRRCLWQHRLLLRPSVIRHLSFEETNPIQSQSNPIQSQLRPE
ncbi:MAG: hypothetical protein ACYTEX_06090, partial [Planctomycetota bacterium]